MRKATLFNMTKHMAQCLLVLVISISSLNIISAQDDCPPLTVFCQDLHTSFMADACMVEVWAKDFVSKINDSQTSLDSFDISFEEDSIVMSQIFESMFGSTYQISIWITSKCDPNLQTRCIVNLDINDNTGNCPGTPCPVDPNPWCGYSVITCTTVQQTATETTGHVAAIMDTRKNSTAPRGDDWASPITTSDSINIERPEAWRISNIGNIYGIALNPTNGDIFFGASDVYDFDFQEFITQGPPPPSVIGPAGAAGIYRTSFGTPEVITPFVSTRTTYPSAANFNAAIIGSNLIPNTGNAPGSIALSGNGIGNLDYDLRSNHIFASNLEDGKIYSINASTGIITAVFDPFQPYTHIAGKVTASERVWGVQVHDCRAAARLYFARNARVPSTAPDVIQPKEIWSVAINTDGTFSGVERIEIVVGQGDMSKITDMAFSSDCESILVAERGNAHSAEMHRYIRNATDDAWIYDRQFFLGLVDPNNTNPNYPTGIAGNSAAGGVAYGPTEENCTIDASCDGVVWGTLNCGDILADNDNPPNGSGCAIYGAEGADASGNDLDTHDSTDIYISLDIDVNNPVILKSNIGDIEFFNCCCPFDQGRQTIVATQRAMIGGEIFTEEKYRVTGASVALSFATANQDEATNQNGEYLFEGLDMYQDYTVRPSLSGDMLDGISTLDLVYIQRHILGLRKLNSPYKRIAADVNRDERISAQDLVSLRRLLLGIDTPEDIASWDFVPHAYQFGDINDVHNYDRQLTLEDLDQNMMHEDFVAIKIGDVTGDNHYNILGQNRSLESIGLDITIEGKTAYVRVNRSLPISGLQFELDLGDAQAQNIRGEVLDISLDNVNLASNSLKLSWANSQDIEIRKGDVLFTFDVNLDDLGDLAFDMTGLRPEIYSGGSKVHSLVLHSTILSSSTQLHGNVPNPFDDYSNIIFDLAENQEVTFEFFTVSGQRISRVTKQFDKGRNTLLIDESVLDYNNNEVIIYRMESNNFSSFGKMIRL